MQKCELMTTVTPFSKESYALYDKRYFGNMQSFLLHFQKNLK